MKDSKILIIDDDPEMLRSSEKVLKASGFNTNILNDSTRIESLLKEKQFDLILCDLLMPEVDGTKVLEIVKEEIPDVPVIIFTAYGTIDRAVACMKAGAFDFIEKPFEAEHLKILVEKALKYSKVYKERNNLIMQLEEKYKFKNIIGRSEPMLKIFEVIDSIAMSDANVLITGESGTGKELIARSIHAKSNRKLNPFVPVNCGAFPENLFEAELFGHEKGAFTGAVNRKIGLVEFANKGTFFLDEVCELPINLQAKFLRVLQEKKLRRIGDNELISVDVRLISATNRNTDNLLENGALRKDFYYRLNVINIHMPPLRKRNVDIPILAEHFLKKYSKKMNKSVSNFDDEVLNSFEEYNWPGNVRELENAIERAVAFTKSNTISLSNLPAHFSKRKIKNYDFNKSSLKKLREEAVKEVEVEYLNHLLNKHSGNITKAAEEAGMTRRNAYRLINLYQIDINKFRE